MNTGPTDRGTGGHDDAAPDDAAPDDAALLAELDALLLARSEPPAHVLHAARESFTWRTVDAEIADLTYDTLLDDVTTTRAADQPRILTFEANGLTIEVELDASARGRRLLGQLVPGQPAELELRSDGAVIGTATADELGRFVLALPDAPQRVSLWCRLPDGERVESASAVL